MSSLDILKSLLDRVVDGLVVLRAARLYSIPIMLYMRRVHIRRLQRVHLWIQIRLVRVHWLLPLLLNRRIHSVLHWHAVLRRHHSHHLLHPLHLLHHHQLLLLHVLLLLRAKIHYSLTGRSALIGAGLLYCVCTSNPASNSRVDVCLLGCNAAMTRLLCDLFRINVGIVCQFCNEISTQHVRSLCSPILDANRLAKVTKKLANFVDTNGLVHENKTWPRPNFAKFARSALFACWQ